ncbi:MAG: hypothetical protein U9N61_02045, partial [Euryarchaeota archaeon]|nr:hypothetical protein [Euryarchaeota archaeon]
VEKEYYKTNGDSYLANFTVPVEPYILLWLYPREPSVTTSAATEVTSTSAILNGELTDLDGIDASQTCFQYGEVGSSHTTLDEWTLFEPGAFSQTVTGLTPNTTYNFRIRGTNETEEDTFYVFGETKQFTTLAEAAPPVVYTYDTDEITESGALLRGYLGTSGGVNTDIGFEYGKTDSYGTMIWTDVYTEPGYYTKAITGLDPNTLYHLRAIASNVYGTGYGTDKTFTTLESTAANMHIILPNANGKLFLSNTVIACDDPDDACTEFRFQIRNDGNTTMAAWYKVSVVGGATLYDGGIVEINPGATSIVIDDTVCALPGGLPVGTHAIKVETGPIGQAATDTYTEPLYVMGEGTAPSGVYTTSENYVNVCGAEIANNCITVDVFVEHFGSDSECDVYLEYWSIGDTEHNFTDPITVPYDPEYDEYGGFELQGVTSCISDCERDFHVRAVASNSVGSNHSETVSPITVRLDPVEYVTETTATLRADILSMGTVSSGVWMFRYGTPTPNTWTTVTSISDTGPLGVTIHELEPNTTYQYYFLARNRYGYPQTFSTTASFTTLGAEPPQVTTGGAFVVNDTTVELEGTLTSTGGASTCDLYFRYGYDESCIHSSKDYSVYDTAGSPSDFILTIGGLTEGATLYYRAAAKCNGLEEVVGGLKQIALPAPTYDITFVATAPGISDLHNVDVNDITDPQNPLYLGKT